MSELLLQPGPNEYEVITDGQVVGRISLFSSSPAGTPWMWSIDFDFQEGRERTYGFEASRDTRCWFRDSTVEAG